MCGRLMHGHGGKHNRDVRVDDCAPEVRRTNRLIISEKFATRSVLKFVRQYFD